MVQVPHFLGRKASTHRRVKGSGSRTWPLKLTAYVVIPDFIISGMSLSPQHHAPCAAPCRNKIGGVPDESSLPQDKSSSCAPSTATVELESAASLTGNRHDRIARFRIPRSRARGNSFPGPHCLPSVHGRKALILQ